MKKRLMRTISCAVMTVTMFTVSTTSVMAYSITNGGKGFSSAWERSVTSDGGKAILKYGFNKFAVDEDYAHAYHSTKRHYAYVKNSNGSFSGSNANSKRWSKIEVRHKGSSITYGNSY